MLDVRHPANARVLAYLGDPARLSASVSVARERIDCAPGEVADPALQLGAHPDLLERLWDQLGGALPKDCRRIVYGTPALVQRQSGVLFAFGGGTSTYALRLPPPELALALARGAQREHRYPAYPQLGIEASQLDLRTIGDDWVFGGFWSEELAWCRAAYQAAAAPSGRARPS